jgi:hypothetical protein
MESESNPVVYVVQEQSNFDYSQAEEYGDVEFLTAVEFSKMRKSIKNQHLKEDLKNGLRKYRAGHDCIVLTGSPIVMSLAFHYACEHGDTHNVLKWCSQKRGYDRITVEV